MAYERLTALGTEKFNRVLEMFKHNIAASVVARIIRDEWGDAQDVRAGTLAKQLTRLNAAMQEGACPESRDLDIALASVRRQLNGVSTVDCLTRLEELAWLMREVVLDLAARQRESKRLLRTLQVVTRNYKAVLLSIQKMRFDLGIDEYRGPRVARITNITAIDSEHTRESKDQRQRVIYDACVQVESMLQARTAKEGGS